jgi:hypothetical protein
MPDSFGTWLRQRREERQIDLIAISDRTKIKIALLEGLEMDDISQWPSGIFRRAYIRAYAQMVGLDPDDTLREFLRVHPDPGDISVTTAAAAAAAEAEYSKTAPSLRLRTMVDSAIASLSRRSRPAAIETPPAPPPAPSSDHPPEAAPATHREEAAAGALAAEVQATNDSKLELIARLCTELGRVADSDGLQKLLDDCAAALSASGLIVWVWDDVAEALGPALVHGYSDKVLARVPAVSRDADNATAEAFRSSAPCEVPASTSASGALVVPMLAVDGCTGVLAIELRHGVALTPSLRATATTLAAALTQVIARSRPFAGERRERPPDQLRRPAR